MTDALSMQDTILRLHEYWADHGCLIWQPYSEKVGAGTMNPATVLRVLGPEPWNVAYVEPSFRADDGRYAENPNRMQMHNQYQVILKPDPGNPQELYLGSLEAIGLDRAKHDIRFVEDNWESPALGAWGLGWEVWLDGQEITQFTYFQQSGSLTLDPVSVEITYGLDRIIMYLQGKTDVWSLDVDDRHSFADVYKAPEIEHCIYNFELADVERMKQLFEIYQAEAQACIERGLVVPAHDFILRQSHTFNLLDSRGAVGVTERAKFFTAMRNQSRSVAELYLEQRQREEFPWLEDDDISAEPEMGMSAASSREPAVEATETADAQDFVLELGSEELPPIDVVGGIEQIQQALPKLLEDARLAYEGLNVTGTTRRLVAQISGLAPAQTDVTIEKRGPAIDRAYDDAGRPTKAAEGFARGQGISVEDLEQRDGYVYAITKESGRPTIQVLPELCRSLLDGLRWRKTMRWNSAASYPRPLRWIVTLYGDQVVSFSWAGTNSGNISRGPRFADATANLSPGEFTTFEIASAKDYASAVAEQDIILDRDKRQSMVQELIQKAAAQVNGAIPEDQALLDEVTDLVEAPQALLGSFEEKYLDLPIPVLISVMKKHQRYFNVMRDGKLLPNFVTVANALDLPNPDVVIAGNEGVIRARYADAAYFYRQDTTRSLESYTDRLSTLTFHERLGSMLDKVDRLQELAPQIAAMLGASQEEQETVQRAAALSKSDLVTSMVVEMTSLQGVIGEIYALNSGETAEVATTLREHYLPRFAGDTNPQTLPGLALSIADKLDSIAGLFAAGAMPTGSADPFGLRRAALGIVNNLLAASVDFNIAQGLEISAELQPIPVDVDTLAAANSFIARRLQGVLLDSGYAHDVVEAVLASRSDNPNAAVRACEALTQTIEDSGWEDAFTAYARCARITRSLEADLTLNPGAYIEGVENQLHDAYDKAAAQMFAINEPADRLGESLRELQNAINVYFETVLVNAEDATLRNARLALVQHIAQLPVSVADLSKLQGF
jgi:glycyl-tRNA synthetase